MKSLRVSLKISSDTRITPRFGNLIEVTRQADSISQIRYPVHLPTSIWCLLFVLRPHSDQQLKIGGKFGMA